MLLIKLLFQMICNMTYLFTESRNISLRMLFKFFSIELLSVLSHIVILSAHYTCIDFVCCCG